MNAPHSPLAGSAPLLPPLSSHAAPGTAPRVKLTDSLGGGVWTPGFGQIVSDLDEPFTRPCDPTPTPDAQWLAVSTHAARLIGQDAAGLTSSDAWLQVLSGCAAPDHMQPYAAVYAGHQFGGFAPRLGDGRALNLGAINGWELQLKGAGPTPYARFADGRAVLRSSIREFLCSEAMHALGIPTTRALSLTISTAPVMRETMETAAVVCRLAPSFVRFGNFEYFTSRGRIDLLERLVRHVYPEFFSAALLGDAFDAQAQSEACDQAKALPIDQLTIELLNRVSDRTARLMTQWMGVGFMHGVMNTDNFSILGLTIDYGPFGFMDAFDADHICNHSDHSGRYRYQAQPQVGLWNIGRLANALYPLVGNTDRLEPVLETFKATYAETMQATLREKFGLQGTEQSSWNALLSDFYSLMQEHRIDYTQAFRALSQPNDTAFLDLVVDRDAVGPWLARYRTAAQESLAVTGRDAETRFAEMRRVNPKYVLRNWIAEEVIRGVRDEGDTAVFEQVFRALQSPFDEHPDCQRYAGPPPDWAQHLSVSCSS